MTQSGHRNVQQGGPTTVSVIVNATTIGTIDEAFASFARGRPDALFVAPDGFFASRAVQFATLSARDKIPAVYSERDTAAVGGLMSDGADVTEMYHQVGVYTGSILKGSKPADMPVMQATKFEFVINLQTARALGIEVPSSLLSIAERGVPIRWRTGASCGSLQLLIQGARGSASDSSQTAAIRPSVWSRDPQSGNSSN